MLPAMEQPHVEEIQGLYGPFILAEKVLQRIWAHGDYHDEGLKTTSGRSLEVLDPGRWNRHEGPDFKEARLRLGGGDCCGDVEIHFKPEDWGTHGHDANPNFDRVVLHVVLQASVPGKPICRTSRGEVPETLVLLPLLERDLESYAMDEALIDLEQVNELAWVEDFLELPESERAARLETATECRWRQKADFAAKRLAVSEWSAVCHASAMEVLGYSRNRAPMHRLALENSLGAFAAGLDVDALYAGCSGRWRLQGLRPANHPKKRLLQYAAICRDRPDWPQRMRRLLEHRVDGNFAATKTRAFRKALELARFREQVAEEVFGGHLGGTRLDTMLCDAIFPLAAAAGMPGVDLLWRHWYPGDGPAKLGDFLREAGLLGPDSPKSNGGLQGALALFMAEGSIHG